MAQVRNPPSRRFMCNRDEKDLPKMKREIEVRVHERINVLEKLVRQLINLIVSYSLALKSDQVLYRYYYRTMKLYRNLVSFIITGVEKCRGSEMRVR